MWAPIAKVVDFVHPGQMRRRMRHNWSYVALLVFIVLPLLWMAIAMAIRGNMFSFTGGPPTPDQLKAFLTFIGGGLATAVTMFGALLTRTHNARERRRMQLEAVLKTFEYMPKSPTGRLSGALPAMVLLGQKQVALRVLDPAWERGEVDDDAATWVLGQVLRGDLQGDALDREYLDRSAVDEASVLLRMHAREKGLTESRQKGTYHFPGDMDENWNRQLSSEAKHNMLKATAYVLLSQDRNWWSPKGKMPYFPTRVWVDCIHRDYDPVIRSSAAVLLGALRSCFRSCEVAGSPGLAGKVDEAVRGRKATAAEGKVPERYRELAGEISRKLAKRPPCEEWEYGVAFQLDGHD